MDGRVDRFPSRAELWQGVVLGTIAHAIWVAPDATYAYSQGWDGPNYLLKDGSGDVGAITFTPEHVVAAFFDLHSDRSPHRASSRLPFGSPYHADDYFATAPDAVRRIAREETLQYLLDDCDGTVQPTITAACWSEGATLTAREPWAAVRAHAGNLIAIQTMPPEAAIAAWTENYEFNDDQIALLRGLFARRMAADRPIAVAEEERRVLTGDGEAGLAESRELLAAVGIALP
jgi:hypothetical protein